MQNKHSQCKIEKSVLLLLVQLCFSISAVQTLKVSEPQILPNDTKPDFKCDINLLTPYMSILDGEEDARATELIHKICPNINLNEKVCCKEEHVLSLLAEEKEHSSVFLHSIEQLSLLRELLEGQVKLDDLEESLKTVILENKCPEQINFATLKQNLEEFIGDKSSSLDEEKFFEYQLKVQSSFMCNICSYKFSNYVDTQRQVITYSSASFTEFLTMMQEYGQVVMSRILALQNITDSLYCMYSGSHLNKDLLLDEESVKMGKPEYKDFINNCVESLLLRNIEDSECLKEAGNNLRMNDLHLDLQLYKMGYNSKSFLFGLFNKSLGDIVSFSKNLAPLRYGFSVAKTTLKASSHVQMSSPNSHKKLNILIDSDPNESFEGSLYGKELTELKKNPPKMEDLQITSENYSDMNKIHKVESKKELAMSNTLRMYPIIDQINFTNELEIFEIEFDMYSAVDVSVNTPNVQIFELIKHEDQENKENLWNSVCILFLFSLVFMKNH